MVLLALGLAVCLGCQLHPGTQGPLEVLLALSAGPCHCLQSQEVGWQAVHLSFGGEFGMSE